MCPHHYHEGLPGESEDDFATRCADELEKLILAEGADTIAAFFAEPVMGAGGVVVPPKTYFQKIQPILKKYDIWFVADEVINWEIRHAGSSITYLMLEQQRNARNKVIVGALNLSQVAAILEHK